MSDYPELYKEYSDYISLINSLQSKDPASLAAGYWLRWYWVKACGELWTASNKTDSNVFFLYYVVMNRLKDICQIRLIL